MAQLITNEPLNPVTQRRDPLRNRVTILTVLNCLDQFFLDGRRNIKVRLTDRKINWVFELGRQIEHPTNSAGVKVTGSICDPLIKFAHDGCVDKVDVLYKGSCYKFFALTTTVLSRFKFDLSARNAILPVEALAEPN